MHEDDDEPLAVPALPLRKIDVAILAVTCLAGFSDDLATMLMQHANYQSDRRDAENAMRADIERIVSGE